MAGVVERPAPEPAIILITDTRTRESVPITTSDLLRRKVSQWDRGSTTIGPEKKRDGRSIEERIAERRREALRTEHPDH